MKLIRKMRRLDDLYDSDFDSGTDSTPIHSPTPKSCKLAVEAPVFIKKRRRKPIDSDSDSDVDVPQKIASSSSSRPERFNQPESSGSLTLDVTQPMVVSAGADVMLSHVSSILDSPKVIHPTVILAPQLLHSCHSKAATSSEDSLSLQNTDEIPRLNQEDATGKSVAGVPYVKPIRERSKMCLGDLLDKRPYQKSPIISKLAASSSPGAKTPIVASSSSSSLNQIDGSNSAAQESCVRLKADDDDWMEDSSPIKNCDSPVRKKRKNAKDDKIIKTIENKSRKKDNDSVEKNVNKKQNKTKKEKRIEEEDVRNKNVGREDVKKEEDGLYTMKDPLTAARSVHNDVPMISLGPLLLPLIPLNTTPSTPVPPVLTISLPTVTTPTTTTESESVPGSKLLGLTSTPIPSRRNLPKSLISKENVLIAAENIIKNIQKMKNIQNFQLLRELDAALRMEEFPMLLAIGADLSSLSTPLNASRSSDTLNDVTAFCPLAVKEKNSNGES